MNKTLHLLATVPLFAAAGCSTVHSEAMVSDPAPTSTPINLPPLSKPVHVTTDYVPGKPLPPGETEAQRSARQTYDSEISRRREMLAADHARLTGYAGDPTIGKGIAYFLAKQLAVVKAKRVDVVLDKEVKALGAAELAASAAKANVALVKAQIAESEKKLDAHLGDAAVRELLLARIAEQSKALKGAEAALSAADIKLNEARANVTTAATAPAGPDGKPYKLLLSVELQAPTADTKFGFRLNPNHSILRDDEHKLVLTPTGLLSTTSIVAVDRTADVVYELATFAGAIAQPVPAGPRSLAEQCVGPPQDEFTGTVDFADQDSVDDLNRVLGCMGGRLVTSGHQSAFARSKHPGAGARFDGIVYRNPGEVMVWVQKCNRFGGTCSGDEGWLTTQIMHLQLPQAGAISFIPQRAGMFTKTTYSTVFKDGMLLEYSANRPSEVMHLAALPMRVVQGVFDGASKIISLRTGRYNDTADYYASQLAVVQAQNKFLIEESGFANSLSQADLVALQSQSQLGAAQIGAPGQLNAAQLAALEQQFQQRQRLLAICAQLAALGQTSPHCSPP